MPAFLQQMSNPAVQEMTTNPNVLSALDQIQRGLEALRTNMPNAGGPLGGQSFFPTSNANTTATADSTVPNDMPSTESQDNNFGELMRRMVSIIQVFYCPTKYLEPYTCFSEYKLLYNFLKFINFDVLNCIAFTIAKCK